MADVNQNVIVRLLAENKTQGAFRDLDTSLKNLRKEILGVASALAGGLALKDIIETTRRWGTEVDRLQNELGLAATEASKLNFIAQSVGLTNEELSGTFGILNKRIADSAEAIIKGESEFDKWGITLKGTGNTIVGFDEAMRRIKTRFQEVGQNAQGSALLMDIFGRSGKALSDFLALSNAEMQEMIQTARDFGLILDGQGSQSLQNFNRQMFRFELQMTGIKLAIGQFLLPLLSALLDKIRQAAGFFKSLGEAIGRMLGPFKEWIDKLGGVKAIADALLTIGVALLGLAVLGGMIALLGWIGSLILKAVPLAAIATGLSLVALAIKDIADTFNSEQEPLDKLIRIVGDIGAALIGVGAVMLVFNAPAAIVITALGLVLLAASEVADMVRFLHDNWDEFVLALRTGQLNDIPIFGAVFAAINNIMTLWENLMALINGTQPNAPTTGSSGGSGLGPGAGAGGGAGGGGGGSIGGGGSTAQPMPDCPAGTVAVKWSDGHWTCELVGSGGGGGGGLISPMAMTHGSGGGTTVVINVAGSVISENELVDTINDKLARRLFAQRQFSF